MNIVNKASAERTAREISALAQAALFTNQIPAFEAAPSVYTERAYLQTFARATANARKYILLTTNTHDVLTFDLQESIARQPAQFERPRPQIQIIAMKRNPLTLVIGLLLIIHLRPVALRLPGPHDPKSPSSRPSATRPVPSPSRGAISNGRGPSKGSGRLTGACRTSRTGSPKV